METIYRISLTLRNFIQQRGLLVGFICISLLLLVGVRFNVESYHFGTYSDDEYHTIHQGLNLIVNGEVDNFRAQEGARWLVRAFYPYALVYMNTHMGGNVYIDGWTYPGHDYVTRNFINSSESSTIFLQDPNLRLLFHALRIQYIVFVFICILLLALFLWNKGYIIAAAGIVLLLGFSADFTTEQKLFYLEPAMLASISVLLWAYCGAMFRKSIRTRDTILFGLICAFMVSTKFSTILFTLLPLIAIFYLYPTREGVKKTSLYVLSAVASYAIINFPAFLSLSSFNKYIHDISSNFWQYAAGSDAGITVAGGLVHAGLLAYQLEGFFGYALYALPLVVIFALYSGTSKERMIILPTLLLSLLSAYSLSKQQVYIPRNLVAFYLPFAMVACMSLEILLRRVWVLRGPRYVLGGVSILVALWVAGVVVHAGGASSFVSTLIPNAKSGFIEAAESHTQTQHSWYQVGFPNKFFNRTSLEKIVQTLPSAPATLNSSSYPRFEAQFRTLSPEAIVLVNNTSNNKHLSTYILPKYFKQNIQVGNYFLFFNVQ